MDFLRLIRSCPPPAPDPAPSSFEAWLATEFPGSYAKTAPGSTEPVRSEKNPEIPALVLGEFTGASHAPLRGGLDERPSLPLGESYERNAQKAEAWGRTLPEGFVLLYLNVRNHARYDYKQQGPQYQDAGNFNFGYMTAAMGLPLELGQRGAGWAQQRACTSRPEWGDFRGGPPYGDDPHDQELIRRGYDAYYRDNPGEKVEVDAERQQIWDDMPLD